MSSALRRTVPPLPGTRCSERCTAGGIIIRCAAEKLWTHVDYTSGFHVQLESRTADCSFLLAVFIRKTSLRVYVCAISAVTECNRVSSPLFHLIRNVSIYSVRLVSLVD